MIFCFRNLFQVSVPGEQQPFHVAGEEKRFSQFPQKAKGSHALFSYRRRVSVQVGCFKDISYLMKSWIQDLCARIASLILATSAAGSITSITNLE